MGACDKLLHGWTNNLRRAFVDKSYHLMMKKYLLLKKHIQFKTKADTLFHIKELKRPHPLRSNISLQPI